MQGYLQIIFVLCFFFSPPLWIYPPYSPILLLSKYKWLPPPFKMPHHLLPLLVLNPNRNMKFSSVLEVETPVILLPTIYVMLWSKKGLSPLRTTKILRWEIPFRRQSWMQSKNRGRQSSFCLKIMHLPHGAWKNLLRLLNAWRMGWRCCPFSTTGIFEVAFAEHEKHFNENTVQKWRAAFTEVANLPTRIHIKDG